VAATQEPSSVACLSKCAPQTANPACDVEIGVQESSEPLEALFEERLQDFAGELRWRSDVERLGQFSRNAAYEHSIELAHSAAPAVDFLVANGMIRTSCPERGDCSGTKRGNRMAGTRARMLCISAVVACLGVLVTGSTANADPINPPIRGLVVTMNCDQLGSFEAIAEGNGRWDRAAIPQHALDSNRVLIAYAEHY
jgi:hypothetical protein